VELIALRRARRGITAAGESEAESTSAEAGSVSAMTASEAGSNDEVGTPAGATMGSEAGVSQGDAAEKAGRWTDDGHGGVDIGAGLDQGPAGVGAAEEGDRSGVEQRRATAGEMAEWLRGGNGDGSAGSGAWMGLDGGGAEGPAAGGAAAAEAAGGTMARLSFNLIPTREFGLQMLRMPK
jgi:hypothetical protein